jgi:hypothetical protein
MYLINLLYILSINDNDKIDSRKNKSCKTQYIYIERPQLMCDYPLNLSILIRGGKETKWDSLSSGERNGISSARRVIGLIVY